MIELLTVVLITLITLLILQIIRSRRILAERHYFEEILDAIPQPITVTDLNMRWTFVNKAVEEMLGVNRETIYGMHCSNWKADICNTDKCGIVCLRKGQTKSEFQNKESDHWYQTNVSYIHNKKGEKTGHIELVWDIHAERASEELQIATLRSIGDGVIACDKNGVVTLLNKAAESLTGWSADSAIGCDIEAIFNIVNEATRGKVTNPVHHALREGISVELPDHTLLISHDGTEYRIADSCTLIRDVKEKVLGAVLVFRDITAEYALQEQLNHSRKMDAIGQLAGGVAHDFNNMLGGIRGCAELLQLQENVSGNEESKEYLSMILTSAERAADLAGKLLTFSRRQIVHSTPVDAHQAIKDAISLLEKTIDKRIEIISDLSAEASVVIGDLTQLQNIFLNIGINASHAMPEGGTLSFTSKMINLTETYCDASPFDLVEGNYIGIEIRDTGCGIKPENLSHIFEPFYTTKEQGKGTGLGLAAAYGAVQSHKGSITVYSEPGNGTCFHILLPLTDKAVRSLHYEPEAIHGKGLVLVVDDESVMRTVARAFLKQWGYDTLVAENGRMAVELYREHAGEIDLVILDMIMPEMNGRDCFFAMKSIRPDAKIVLSSGFSRNEDIKDLKEHGLTGFVKKPFSSAEFSKIVAAALRG